MTFGMPNANKNPKNLIDFFGAEYGFLCNFHECTVIYNGLRYRSSEAAFAAQKTTNPKLRKKFMRLFPQEAMSMGRRVRLRKDWDSVKFEIMSEVVHAKFTQHAGLSARLLNTGNAKLVDGHCWDDRIWGAVDGEGRNWLGIILMAERDYWNRIGKERSHECRYQGSVVDYVSPTIGSINQIV